MRALLAALLILAAAPAAAAENRPSEDALFGAPSPAADATEPGTPGAADSSRPDEDALFGAPGVDFAEPATSAPAASSRPAEDALFGDPVVPEAQPAAAKPTRPDETKIFGGGETLVSEDAAPEDPLSIGGQFYMRALTSASDRPPSQWGLSAPTLVDAYFDARPNDRVRGFILGRLAFDPSAGGAGGSLGTASEPLRMALDQLWLRFDLGRSVFVTAGRQHVKWGPARFWNPTDFLHQIKRNPLDVFDARVGTTMLKLHAPWEKRGWNFYGVLVFEDVVPADTVSHIGGALRAEAVLGPAELGASAIAQRGHEPRFGFDVSSGLGPLDVYGEAALQRGTDTPVYRARPSPFPGPPLGERYEPSGTSLKLTAGANWTFNYSDEDSFTLGGEYFFNSLGYTDSSLYPFLLLAQQGTASLGGEAAELASAALGVPKEGVPGSFSPFYLGRHYAGLYALLMNPGSWNNTTFTLSTLGNLSDRSFVSRLDYSVLALTHLRFEAFGAVHYGHRGGEFRFAVDGLPPELGEAGAAMSFPPAIFEAGVGLRISI